MKKTTIIAFLLAMTLEVLSQKVTFYSLEFEEGIRLHLGLDETDDVLQMQTDTITHINLSGLGISDIRDVVYLPMVRYLNLSYNCINDISPLIQLDSLRLLDLGNNQLENINILVLTNAGSMEIDVSNNFISDFSYFFSPSHCSFTLLGMGLQQEKNSPYFDVYQLYADVDDAGEMKASWRGYTNMKEDVTLKCGEFQVPALMDGYTNSVMLPQEFDTITQIVLFNGEAGDTTYVIPPAFFEVEFDSTVIVETGLPDSYQIGYANTLYGTVSVAGQAITYTASSIGQADTIYFSYYQGESIKGFGEYYIGFSEPNGIQQIVFSGNQLKIDWHDGKIYVEYPKDILNGCSIVTISVWSAVGQLLAVEDFVTTSSGADAEIMLPNYQDDVVIVQVDYCNKRIIGKCFLSK